MAITKSEIEKLKPKIDKKFNEELLIIATESHTICVYGLTEKPYTFLQNINRLKAYIYSLGYTFKPVERINDQCVLMELFKRDVKK